MKQHKRRWRPRVDPLRHGLFCPRCHSSFGRHGKGGKRACKEGPVDECPGVVCTCEIRHFVQTDSGPVWRRSPCTGAVCRHCGWTGTLESQDFERRFDLSRCPGTEDGRHDVTVVLHQSDSRLSLNLYCRRCECVGHVSIDPIDDIYWRIAIPEEDK